MLSALASGNHLYGDAQQAITGNEARTALVQALTAQGLSPADAAKYQAYVDAGAVVVTLGIVGGQAVYRFTVNSTRVSAADRAALASLEQKGGFANGAPGGVNAPNTGTVAYYGPLNQGPLPNEIARTFRSGSYQELVTAEPTTLYRVISDNGNPSGGYWTRIRPDGPLQSVIDSALDQNWGNTATRVIQMEVPAGTRLFEGVAAPQRGLVGGGNQIYFDRILNPVDPSWIK